MARTESGRYRMARHSLNERRAMRGVGQQDQRLEQVIRLRRRKIESPAKIGRSRACWPALFAACPCCPYPYMYPSPHLLLRWVIVAVLVAQNPTLRVVHADWLTGISAQLITQEYERRPVFSSQHATSEQSRLRLSSTDKVTVRRLHRTCAASRLWMG